ncbi:MAG: NlpC/P60 family protein [Alphaproteobacteria bacterium]
MTADRRLTPARPDLAADYLRSAVQADEYVKGWVKQVHAPSAPVHSAPDTAAQMVTEALMGEQVTVYEEKDGWAWGQLSGDEYVGYLPADTLGEIGPEISHKVGVLRSFVYAKPDLKSQVLGAVSLGVTVSATGTEAEFTRLDGGGYLFSDHLLPADHVEADYLTTGVRFIGTPYLWGGKTSLGLDCSGLVQISLQLAGVACPRDSDMQATALGEAVEPNPSNVQRGDLVFFPGHVGMMLDEQTILHANAWDMMVSPHPLRYVIAEIGKKEKQPLTAIKRLV